MLVFSVLMLLKCLLYRNVKEKLVIEMLKMLVLDMVDVFLVYYIFSYKI